MSHRRLIGRLEAAFTPENLPARPDAAGLAGTTVTAVATNIDGLRALLADAPDVLFTASHGAGFAGGGTSQAQVERLTGALVCTEPDGPSKPPPLFTVDDVTPSMDLCGSVAVLFACFSAGCPAESDFTEMIGEPRSVLSERPFTSRLAHRLLAAGAGAVIGHVERAWSTSLGTAERGAEHLMDVAACLLTGRRVGSASELVNNRFAGLTVNLAEAFEKTRFRGPAPKGDPNVQGLALLWIDCYDARNTVVLGDPAARAGRVRSPRDIAAVVPEARVPADLPAEAATLSDRGRALAAALPAFGAPAADRVRFSTGADGRIAVTFADIPIDALDEFLVLVKTHLSAK